MRNPVLVPELRELLAAGDAAALQEFCSSTHPASIAEFLSGLEAEEVRRVLVSIEPPLAAEIVRHFDEDVQGEVVEQFTRDELARLVTDMAPDDRVDLVKRIPEEKQHALLPALAKAEREDIRRLASYEEGTAGSIMTSDYAWLPPGITAAEAIERLRREAPDKETIYYAYVLDDARHLLGFVSLKDLILARPDRRVEDLMQREPVFVRAHDDQEDAARLISKYDLIALPVVNGEGGLVGIITHDDALDVITQENTEDMEKLMAIGGAHEAGAYLRTPAWNHFKNRCGWILALAVLGLVSGAIVKNYEALIVNFAILATFMPMLADTGGNTGSQSATLVVRALALGEVGPRDVLRVLRKEAQVGLLLSVLLAGVAFARVGIFSGGGSASVSVLRIGTAVSLALGLQVVSATLIGAMLPLIAARLRFDPAVVASPALTTVVDITGLLIYFSVAKAILGPVLGP